MLYPLCRRVFFDKNNLVGLGTSISVRAEAIHEIRTYLRQWNLFEMWDNMRVRL